MRRAVRYVYGQAHPERGQGSGGASQALRRPEANVCLPRGRAVPPPARAGPGEARRATSSGAGPASRRPQGRTGRCSRLSALPRTQVPVRRLLFDLNVILDVLLDRPPHAAAAAAVWAAAERKQVDGLIPAHGVTTIFYIAARQRDAAYARRVVGDLLTVFRVAPVDHSVIRRALTLGWRDFEDAVCAAAAEAAGCKAIVTRDPRGFAASPVEVMQPEAAAVWRGQPEGRRRGRKTRRRSRRVGGSDSGK